MWRFFKPKHTVQTVAKQLAEGLENGTVLLRPGSSTEAGLREREGPAQLPKCKCPICGGSGKTSYNGSAPDCPHTPRSETLWPGVRGRRP
jgi:hypothetical protein